MSTETSKNEKLPFETQELPNVLVKIHNAVGKFGQRPEERDIDTKIQWGFINIDKPSGPTSHNVSAYIKQIFTIHKAGHSGTLDPMVTGCLPIALGQTTRLNELLLTAGKEYICVMHLHDEQSKEKIQAALKKFTGTIQQQVPRKAAVKRQVRPRTIYYNHLLDIKDKDVLFKVGCQAGTYIRVLCHDIGQELGCGAHMKELRRTKAGPFQEETLITINDVHDAYFGYKEALKANNEELKQKTQALLHKYILPPEYALQHIKKIWITDENIQPAMNGRGILSRNIIKLHDDIEAGQKVALMTAKDEVLGIVVTNHDSDTIMNEDVIAAKVQSMYRRE